jgi:hypothetical protein
MHIHYSIDNKTIIFKPDIPFTNGEIVTVKLEDGLTDKMGSQIGGINFNFNVATKTLQPHEMFYIAAEEFKTTPTVSNQINNSTFEKKTFIQSQLILAVPSGFSSYSIQKTDHNPEFIFLDNDT